MKPTLTEVEKVSQHFDQIAREYDKSIPLHVRDHYLERRIDLISKLIQPPARILEVGCGTGLMARRLIGHGYDVHGIDVSGEMLREGGMDRMKNFVVGSAANLPFQTDDYDLSYCVATMHHIADQNLVRKSVYEMARVTKPGGRVLIIDHNPLNPYWPLLMKRVPQDSGDERLIPLAELIQDALDAGAKKIEWKRTGFTPDFTPKWFLPIGKFIERFFERIPLVTMLGAHNVIIFQK